MKCASPETQITEKALMLKIIFSRFFYQSGLSELNKLDLRISDSGTFGNFSKIFNFFIEPRQNSILKLQNSLVINALHVSNVALVFFERGQIQTQFPRCYKSFV